MNKKMLLALFAGATLVIAGCSSKSSESGVKSDVVAKTKYGTISSQQLYDSMKGRYGEPTLQELLYEQVLGEKYKIDEKEFQTEYKKFEDQYGSSFEDVVKQSGFASIEDFKSSMRISMLQEKAALAQVKISEDEMKKYYDTMAPELKASHILVGTEKEAKDIIAELNKGGDFAKIAKDKSKDPASAAKGGDLGYFKTGEMVPEFEKAANALKVGEISAPVKSQYGYHVIKLTDRKEKEAYDKLKDEIKKEIGKSKLTADFVQKVVNDELKAAKVDIKDSTLAKQYKEAQEKLNASQGSQK